MNPDRLQPTLFNRTQVALIREDECIGCFRCITACPENAILGASRLMHTVLHDLCTGCENCLVPCPVDCIDLVPANALKPTQSVSVAPFAIPV